jgi:fructose-1,6-bisphosphatase I
MIAHNASNTGHWPALLRDHVESRIAAGANMRWIAAAVGDLHRILLQGGIFLYPADRRKGYENGRLRLLYEAFPIAFLIEQAGGAATDGANRILDRTPESLHQHCPLIFGDREMVAAIPRH